MKILLFLLLLFNRFKFSISGTCPSTYSGVSLKGPSPEGKCFTLLSSRSHTTLLTSCANLGMKTAPVASWSENQYLLDNFVFTNAWIGLNDYVVEGTWVWTWAGAVTQYTNWGSGEPNSSGNEDCVILKSTGKWNDAGCGNSYQAFCAICSTGTYFNGHVCAACPAGTFSNSLTTGSTCTKCAVGYISTPGSESCTICPRGTYSNTQNTECVACPADSVSNAGSSSISQCTPCPDGYYVSNTQCVTCAPAGAIQSRFTGGGASIDNCRCVSPWVGAKCDIDQCPSKLNGISLGGLYLQSLPELKSYSSSFSTANLETFQTVRDLLEDIFYIIIDLDGDERITKDEMLKSLSSKGILNTSLTNLPLWCSTYTTQTCITDTYSCASFIEDSFNNYKNTQSHEFDSSNLPILNSFTATFPNPSWTDSDCSTKRNTNVAVGWSFISNRPALYRVCGYTNGFVDPSFGTAAVVSGSVTSFTDISPITSTIGFKRVYCVEVSYCANTASGSSCTPTTSGFRSGISCTVGLRYDYTPIDLVPVLSDNGVSFTFTDTAVTEARFDIFCGKNGVASTHIVGIPYPSDGCGRISTPISFADRINADLVGRNLVYGVRAVLPAGPTALTVTNYRIPFIGTITGSVKTTTGAPVGNVIISICHIDQTTGEESKVPTHCPLTKAETDQRGLYTIDVRVSNPRWNSTTEQFKVSVSFVEIIDGEELVHSFSPSDQIITLKHRFSTTANFIDDTSISIFGNVKFHPDLVAGNTCPFEGVTVFMNTTTGLFNTTTDTSGNFLFSLTRADSGTIYIPSGWNGHSWIVNATLSSFNLPSPIISTNNYLIFSAPVTNARRLQPTTLEPTFTPTSSPTSFPTAEPTLAPSSEPTIIPTRLPTRSPTRIPTRIPSTAPTFRPTSSPTFAPTKFYSPDDTALLYDFDFKDLKDSISDSNIQIVGTVSVTEGLATFGGLSNSYIILPHRPLREAQAVTIELWVDFGASNNIESTLFSFGPSSNSFSYKSNHKGVSQYIAVVLKNSNGVTRGKVYIDGVLVSTRNVSESSLLGGFAANNNIPGYLGRNVEGTSPPFTGIFKTFRIWWGELSAGTIYSNSAIDGVQQQEIKLTSQMTKSDVQVNFFFTSKQDIQVGFYGDADEPARMFSNNVIFDIKALNCPYAIRVSLDADGNNYIGSIPALNYTVTMNEFTYSFPPFELPTTPLFAEPICANSLQPYDYVVKTDQLDQSLTIPTVTPDPYYIDYLYRSGVCVFVENAMDFNTLRQPVTPPPSTSPTPDNEVCYPKSITVLKEETPYNITIFVFERYPISATHGRTVLRTDVSEAIIFIDDDVSGLNDRLTIPYIGESRSELTPLTNITGYRYTINPKNPYPISPFYWKFQIIVEKPITPLLKNIIPQTWYIPVTGVLTNPFSTFLPVATDPTLIFMVLRDPPGGNSYTTIESGTSIEFAMSLEGMYAFDHGQSWDFNLGAGIFNEVTVPLAGIKLTEVESILIGGGASLGSTLTATRESSTNYQYSFEFTSSFSTSQSPDDAGHGSDMIIGGGVDLIVLEGLAVIKRTTGNFVCFHSENVRVWSPGKVTTFVLAVREIELTISKLSYIVGTESNTTIKEQLNKQISNWNKVLTNYRDHNQNLTSIFYADEILFNQEINNFVEVLKTKSQSMEFDTRYEDRFSGDGFSGLDGKLNQMKYNINSKCGQLQSYSAATSMCDQFSNNNWDTVNKAIQNGACELIIPKQEEGKLKYKNIVTTTTNRGGKTNENTRTVFDGYTEASPNVLKDLPMLKQLCTEREATISNIPGGAIKDVKSSLFGFLEDNNKLITFGSGTETKLSFTSTITNSISLSSGFSYTFDTSGGLYNDLKFAAGAVLIKGGSSVMFSHDREKATNVVVDSNRLTKRTVTVTLSDPDQNDYFAVRITSDSTFGTPVFTTMGGQSSCPAETGTLARESGVRIVDIIPRCGEFGTEGDCINLATGTTAHFTVRVLNFSPTRDNVLYTLGFDSLFDKAPLDATTSYELCNNLSPKEGQRSGLIATFSTTLLHNLPYGVPVEVLVSIENKGPCKNYHQVKFKIKSECETIYKYQYGAERDPNTGNVAILYDEISPVLSHTRAFDVSWQSSSTPQQFSNGGGESDSSTTFSNDTTSSLLIVVFILLILILTVNISNTWYMQNELKELKELKKILHSNLTTQDPRKIFSQTSYFTEEGLSTRHLEVPQEEVEQPTNQVKSYQLASTSNPEEFSQI